MEESLCGICLESVLPASFVIECNHAFHAECVDPWLTKKGTCPTCRFRVREVELAESEDEMEDDVFEALQIAIQAFWSRRFSTLPSINRSNTEHLFESLGYPYEAERESTIHEYASLVSNITETDTEWLYEVEGIQGRSTKAHIQLVQNQTDASLETCLYAMHLFKNDIVNAIMDISE